MPLRFGNYLLYALLCITSFTALSLPQDCSNCSVAETCDTHCAGTCALPRRCPSWLQGEWESAEGDYNIWSMSIVGGYAKVSFMAVPMEGRIFCGSNLSAASTVTNVGKEWQIHEGQESSEGMNVAVEWDLVPDVPTDMKNALIRGVIRLGRTNLQALPANPLESVSSGTTSSIDVLITYGWRGNCYEEGQADPRYPSFSTFGLDQYDDGGFTEGRFRYNTLSCTTPPLTSACPHWLHGQWSGRMRSIHDQGTVLDVWNITVPASGKSTSTFSGKTFQYNVLCSKLPHEGDDIGQWQIDFYNDQVASPPHRLRGVFRVPRFAGGIVHVGAPYNWCQRPHNMSHPSTHPFESTEPVPFRKTAFSCMVQNRDELCTTYLQGNWNGFLLDPSDLSPTDRTATFFSAYGSSVLTDQDGIAYHAEISCGAETLGFTVPGHTEMAAWPETSLDLMYSSPHNVSNWTSHSRFKFERTYDRFSIVIGAPGKCARPLAIRSGPSSAKTGLQTYTFTCALALLQDECPEWLAGPHKNDSMAFDILANRTSAKIDTHEPYHGRIKCKILDGENVLMDMFGTSPAHFDGWVKRAVVSKADQEGTIVVVESPAGLCDRADINRSVNKPFRRTVFPCNTAPLSAPCPGWLQGNWTSVHFEGDSDDIGTLYVLRNTSVVGGMTMGRVQCAAYDQTTALVDIEPSVGTHDELYNRKMRAIAKFDQENGTISFTYGPYGWCTRPDPKQPLANGPYSTVQLACTVERMNFTCPPWIDGKWNVIGVQPAAYAQIRSVEAQYSMTVDGKASISRWYNGSRFFHQHEKLTCSLSSFNSDSYLGETVNVDLEYRLAGLLAIERGQTRLNAVDPVSGIDLHFAPYNWCHRPMQLLSSKPGDGLVTTTVSAGTCATPVAETNCPIWMQGHWKFFTPHGADQVGASYKWIIHEKSLVDQFLNTTATATISCSRDGIVDPDTVRLDISYDTPATWSGRIFRSLAKRAGDKKIELNLPPIGWCSPPPSFLSHLPEPPYRLIEGNLVEVPDPPSALVLGIAQESLNIAVADARSTILIKFDGSVSDNYSPIETYVVEYDAFMPRRMLCGTTETQSVSKRPLSACCERNDDCMSNLCDVETFSCTVRCNSTLECQDATNRRDVICRGAVWLPSSLYSPPNACHTAVIVSPSTNASLCHDVCNISSSFSLDRSPSCVFGDPSVASNPCSKTECDIVGHNVTGVGEYARSNGCCADIIRTYCLNDGVAKRACYTRPIREAISMSGYQVVTFSHRTQAYEVSATGLTVGLAYYFWAYAKNEIGYSISVYSVPRHEIPRALPPPPFQLDVQQVEPTEEGNNSVTLELAKESLDVVFARPTFDNGAKVSAFLLEWDRRIQFDSRSQGRYNCPKEFDPKKAGEIDYGQCSSNCDIVDGQCSKMDKCPLEQSALPCHLCQNNTSAFHYGRQETTAVEGSACAALGEQERALIEGSFGTCTHMYATIGVFVKDPFYRPGGLSCTSTCMKELSTVFAQLEFHRCELTALSTSLERKATKLLCDVAMDGSPCTDVLKTFQDRLEDSTLSCQLLQDFRCCSSSVATTFFNISSSLPVEVVRSVSVTSGEEYFQGTNMVLRREANASRLIDLYTNLFSVCPRYKDESVCANMASNTTAFNDQNDTCINGIEQYCKCENPFDLGCTRYDFSRALPYVPDGSLELRTPNLEDVYTYRISGLEKRTKYRFRISSINSVGQGIALMSIAVPALMIPSKPAYVNVSLVDYKSRMALSTMLNIQFEPALDDQTWTDSFDIEYGNKNFDSYPEYSDCSQMKNSTGDFQCVSINSRIVAFGSDTENVSYAYTVELSSLVPGDTYYVRVYSVIAGRRGRSQASDPLSIVPPLQTPNAPLSLYVTHVNGSTLGVKWSKPDFDGGLPILHYELHYKIVGTTGANASRTQNDTSRAENCTSANRKAYSTPLCGRLLLTNDTFAEMPASWSVDIPHLLMGRYYNISIAACNGVGCGLVERHGSVKTMQPPEAPRFVDQGVYNSTALAVLYSRPISDGGDMITSYMISWTRRNVTFIELTNNQSGNESTLSVGMNRSINGNQSTFRSFQKIQFLDDGARHQHVHDTLFKTFASSTVLNGFDPNCSCLENSGRAAYGGCCCKDNDCVSGICNPVIGACTTECTTAEDCSDPVVPPTERACERVSGMGPRTICTVQCPFKKGVEGSPCTYLPHASNASCTLEDFQSSWIRGQRKGYWNEQIPSKACARQILTYCSIIFPSDSACKWITVKNLMHNIPKCQARPSKEAFVGVRATSLVSGLLTNETYKVTISACNRAGCGKSASVGNPLTPRPQIIISEATQCVVEGKETDSYLIRLNSEPTSAVTLRIAGGAEQLANLIRTVVFTKENWTATVVIDVAALDDDYDEEMITAESLTHSIVTQDSSYATYQEFVPSAIVSLQTLDNDYSGVLVWRTNLTVSEVGMVSSFQYQLRSRPKEPVLLRTNFSSDIALTPANVTFDNNVNDWKISKTVHVAAVDDDFDESPIVQNTVVSTPHTSDGSYMHAFIPDVLVSVLDEDTSGVMLSNNHSAEVAEGGTVVYDIALTSQPRSPVAVIIALDGRLIGDVSMFLTNASLQSFSTSMAVLPDGAYTIQPISLLFDVDETNWMIPKTFTLYAEEDVVDMERAYNILVNHASVSGDPTYNCGEGPSVDCPLGVRPTLNVTILDNDLAGILVSRKNLVVTEDGSRVDSYFMELETAPRARVTVHVQAVHGQAILEPSQLIFTSGNYNTRQKITARSFDDEKPEESVHFDTVLHTLTTEDPIYSVLSISSIALRVIDASAVVDTSKPPEVVKVVQNDVIEELIVHLDRPAYVEYVGISWNQTCEDYFETRSAKSFGQGSFCYWYSPMELRVREGTSDTYEGIQHVVPGDKVAILGGVIRSTLTSVIFTEGVYVLHARVPPPTMVRAFYGHTNADIFVNFTGHCYDGFRQGVSGTPCSNVFENHVILGLDSHCSWVHHCLLRVKLGWGSTVRPAFGLDRCGSCDCTACKPVPAFANYDGYVETCAIPSNECPEEFCFCDATKEESATTLCPDNQALKLISGTVTPLRYSIVSSSGCMKIDEPKGVVSPQALVDYPQLASTCNTLVLDGSNSLTSGGGRDNVTWTLEFSSADKSAISNETIVRMVDRVAREVSDNQGLILNVQASLLQRAANAGAKRLLTVLRITNVFGDTDRFSGDITVSPQPYPTAKIMSNKTLIVKANDGIELWGEGENGCASTGKKVHFEWRIAQRYSSGQLSYTNNEMFKYAQNSRVIKIPPYSFNTGATYVIKLVVSVREVDTSMTNSASITVNVRTGNLIAVVGAETRVASVGQPFVLDGSQSFDEDLDMGSGSSAHSNIAFAWTCHVAGTMMPCDSFIPLDLARVDNTGSVLNFPPNNFKSGLQHVFILTIASVGKTAEARVFVTFVPSKLSSVNIIQDLKRKVSASDRLVLMGQVDRGTYQGGVQFLWEESTHVLDNVVETKQVYGSPLNRESLVILPFSLSPGRRYTFRLSAYAGAGDGAAVYAEVSFEVNLPPSSGYVETTPTHGIGGETVFTTIAGSWVDGAEDLPLTYTFSFHPSTDSTTRFEISETLTYSPQITHMLPGAGGNASAKYKISVTVADALGASFTTSKTRGGQTVIVDIEERSWDEAEQDDAVASMARLHHRDLSFQIVSFATSMNVRGEDGRNSHYAECGGAGTACNCLPGWEGKACDVNSSHVAVRANFRNRLLIVLENGFSNSFPTPAVVQQQVTAVKHLLGSRYEVDERLAHGSMVHVGTLFAVARDTGLAISSSDAAVKLTMDCLESVSACAKMESAVDHNHSDYGRIGNRSRIGKTIVDTSSSLARALLGTSLPGEFPTSLRSGGLSLWAKREKGFSKITVELIPMHGSTFGGKAEIDTRKVQSTAGRQIDATEAIDICAVSYAMSYGNSASDVIVSLELFASAGGSSAPPMTWETLDVPVVIHVPVSLNSATSNRSLARLACGFWDEESMVWSAQGVFTDQYELDGEGNARFACQSTHLSQFSLTTVQSASYRVPLRPPGGEADILFLYDVFNQDSLVAYSVILGTMLLLGLTLRKMTAGVAPYRQFLLYGCTAPPPRNPSSNGPITRYTIRPLSLLYKRILQAFKASHIVFLVARALSSAVKDTTTRPSSVVPNDFLTCTGGLFALLVTCAYYVANTATVTVQPDGVSHTNLDHQRLVPVCSTLGLCAVLLLRWAKHLMLSRTSWHGKVLVNRLGYSSLRGKMRDCYGLFPWFSRLRGPPLTPVAEGISLYFPNTNAAIRWMKFETLHNKCVAYARNVSNKDTSVGRSQTTVYSYEKYVVDSLRHGGSPLSRNVYDSTKMLQALWRGYSVRYRKSIFEAHYTNIYEKRLLVKKEFGVASSRGLHKIKSLSLVLLTVQTLFGAALFFLSINRVNRLFERPYGMSGIVVSLFTINASLFSSYLMKYTAGKILFVYPALLVLGIAVLGAFLGELDVYLEETNWDDLRNIWIDGTQALDPELLQTQTAGGCCGFSGPSDYPAFPCESENSTISIRQGCVPYLSATLRARTVQMKILVTVMTAVQVCLAVFCAVVGQSLQTHVPNDGYITRSDEDRVKSYRDALFLEGNGKLVASTVNTTKIVLDNAARKIQSSVRRYLGQTRKLRMGEIKSMLNRPNQQKVSAALYTAAILLFHAVCGLVTIAYCIKFDPGRKKLWDDTLVSALTMVYLVLQPLVIIGIEICYEGWWYDLLRHASRWTEWVFVENDMA